MTAVARYGYFRERTAVESPHGRLGMLPGISLLAAFALLVIALADSMGRVGAELGYTLFWAGILLLFVPIAMRLAARHVTRSERLGLTVLLGVGCYMVKVLHSPLGFAFGDEFSHWRTANDILTTSHLFSPNTLLNVSPYFPGLEMLTAALAGITGLPVYNAGLVVIGVARLVIMLSLFLIFEMASGSPRVAGIAALLYTANANFLFWSAQFSYESLALPLATFVVYLAVRRGRAGEHPRKYDLALLLSIGALVMIHHLTAYLLVAFLGFWVLVTFALARLRRPAQFKAPYAMTLLAAAAAILWLFVFAQATFGYLVPVLSNAAQDAVAVAQGTHATKTFFRGDTAQVSQPWEQALAFGSVALLALALPVAAVLLWRPLRTWKRYRSNALALTLALAALGFFPAQALRLTTKGSETSNRAMDFLFIAIGFLLALAWTYVWLQRRDSTRRQAVFATFATLLFAGGVIIGMARWARLPGPYLVSGDTRGLQKESMAMTNWVDQAYGTDNALIADRTNELLLGAYGEQRLIKGVSWVYFSPQVGTAELTALRRNGVRFVVVDNRLSLMLPLTGFYFEPGKPDAQQHKAPLAPAALAKFDGSPAMERIFDSGNIVIYAVDGAPAVVPAPMTTNQIQMAADTARRLFVREHPTPGYFENP